MFSLTQLYGEEKKEDRFVDVEDIQEEADETVDETHCSNEVTVRGKLIAGHLSDVITFRKLKAKVQESRDQTL